MRETRAGTGAGKVTGSRSPERREIRVIVTRKQKDNERQTGKTKLPKEAERRLKQNRTEQKQFGSRGDRAFL